MDKQQKWQDILLAVEQNDISKVMAQASLEDIQRLVDERKLDILQPNEECFGDTPIHEAARLDRLGILKYFIEQKHGDVNIRNEFGEPPIFLAAERNHLRIVKYLVTRGANITMTDRHNDNILYIAARKGSIALAEFLLDERKAPFNLNWRNKLNMTIVHYAAKYDQLTFLKYIVGQKKADFEARDNSGRTPLHLAARSDNFESLKYLLKRGANAEPEDNYGQKPWQLAKEQKIIDYLETGRYKRSVRPFVQSADDDAFVEKYGTDRLTSGDWDVLNRFSKDNPKFLRLAREAHRLAGLRDGRIQIEDKERRWLKFHDQQKYKPIKLDVLVYSTEGYEDNSTVIYNYYLTKGLKPDCVYYLMKFHMNLYDEQSLVLGEHICGVPVPSP